MNGEAGLALALFLLVCSALLLLPFYPAWREWRHPADRQPRRMAAGDDSQASLTRLLRQQMAQLQRGGHLVRPGSLEQALDGADPGAGAPPPTAGPVVALECGACFQQIDAPLILFGPRHSPGHPDPGDRQRLPVHGPLPHARPWGAHGWRVDGDCAIREGQHFTGSLVVTGLLWIGQGARVEGDVKGRRGVLIGEHAHVSGSVVSDQGVGLGVGAFVGGPLVCEALLQLGAGARLGRPEAPTSVCASVILAGAGATAHGCVRATQAGLVWGPA